MGYETKCRARVDDHHGRVREADATVLIETDELIVRGEARVRVPRASIQRVTARAGVVTVTAPEVTISLTLGAAAAAWQKRLEEPPKRLIDKLDVKPGAKVWLLGDHDPTLVSQLAERTTRVVRGARSSGCAVAFVAVESASELDRIDRALGAIDPAGAIWVVHRERPIQCGRYHDLRACTRARAHLHQGRARVRHAHRRKARSARSVASRRRQGDNQAVIDQASLLLYDGTCGFCARSVQFVLRFEQRQTLRFATLQGVVGSEIRARHPELAHVDSVVWVERAASGGERVLVRFAAVLRVLDYVGGKWRLLAKVGGVVPRAIGDRTYDFAARHRHQLTRDAPACFVPRRLSNGRGSSIDTL